MNVRTGSARGGGTSIAGDLVSVPPIPHFHVPRPALLDLVDAGANRPLTLVVAPPGAGKTVLLATWVHERCPDALWIQCEPADSGPFGFLTKLGGVLRAADEPHWMPVADALDDPHPDPPIVVDAVLAALDRRPAVLVFDDLHVANEAGPLLARMVDGLPEGSRIVAGSRGEPPLALHRLRATDSCLEVRDAELRLTADEVGALLRVLGATVSAEAATSLSARTDGWVAGVQMAAIAMRDEEDPDQFIAEFSGSVRVVSDYLVGEVLATQPDAVQHFLLRTSVLDELDPWVCGAVTERGGAAAMLRQLHRAALFVVPAGPDSYRYHQLFRDMLRYQLRATDPEAERHAHRLAAEWYLSKDDVGAALQHVVAAGDDDRAFELLNAGLSQVFLRNYRDGTSPLLELLSAVDSLDGTLDANRMVAIASALGMAGEIHLARRWNERAIRRMDELDPGMRDRLAVSHAWVAEHRGEAQLALDLLGPLAPEGSDDDVVIAAPLIHIVSRTWLDDLDGARASAAYSRTLRPLGVLWDEVMIGGALSWTECIAGRLGDAEHLSDVALATAHELEVIEHPAVIECLRTRGRLFFERGDLRAAESDLERSLTVAERRRPGQAFVSAVALARVWMSLGRLSDASEVTANARTYLPPDSESVLLGLLDAVDTRIALAGGDLGRAGDIIAGLERGPRRSRLEARLQLARGEPDRAAASLDQHQPATRRAEVDSLLLRARSAHDLRSPDAEAALSAALDAARPERFTFAVAEELYPLASRVGLLLRSQPVDPFAESVLELFDTVVLPLTQTAAATLVDPLTERELTVLRYLGSHLTLAQIASELYLSVNTVKTHSKAVHRKLAVASRHDAVVEARRLGIR